MNATPAPRALNCSRLALVSSNLTSVMSSGRNKSPTRAQLSSRLAYEKKVPAFLQKLQNKINGVGNDDDDDDEPERYYEDRGYDEDEFEIIDDGSGRPPIPRRPRSRERERPPIPEVSLCLHKFRSFLQLICQLTSSHIETSRRSRECRRR